MEQNHTTEIGNLHKHGLPEKLILLRQKLNEKAKREPKFKFYALYDRIYREDVLRAAYERVKKNKGSAGIDGVNFTDIEKEEGGKEKFLEEIREELITKSYKPQPVKRQYIPKSNGKLRPLGIPTIKDRVVQMAVVLIIEPIFEADFREESYGFRPNRSAHDALERIRENLKEGYVEVYDADLKGYFDSIPHDKLMMCLEQRIADRSVLHLIKMWLESPIVETSDDGKPKVTRNKKGTPQGGVISPLLANLYLHYFDRHINKAESITKRIGARLVRYADDFVLMTRKMTKGVVDYVETYLETRMCLEINREKTRVVNQNKEELNFLGYTFRRDRSKFKGGGTYLNVYPSLKSVEREKERLKEMISYKTSCVPIVKLISQVNRHLKGWKNYYSYGYPRKELRKVNGYVRTLLSRHLKRKSQRKMCLPKGTTDYEYFKKLGLVYL